MVRVVFQAISELMNGKETLGFPQISWVGCVDVVLLNPHCELVVVVASVW